MADETCTRCGAHVPPVLSPPPADKDVWWRNKIQMTRVTTTTHWKVRVKVLRREWLPEHPGDQVRMTCSQLALCDTCAGDVWLFAQNTNRARSTPRDAPL